MKDAVTKVIDTLTQEDFLPWGLAEVVGMVQQVHCSRRRLLRRGQEFHVCTINKSAHTKKSGNLFNDPRIFISSRKVKITVSVRDRQRQGDTDAGWRRTAILTHNHVDSIFRALLSSSSTSQSGALCSPLRMAPNAASALT